MEQEQQDRLFEQACRSVTALAEDTSCHHDEVITNLRALRDEIDFHLDLIGGIFCE